MRLHAPAKQSVHVHQTRDVVCDNQILCLCITGSSFRVPLHHRKLFSGGESAQLLSVCVQLAAGYVPSANAAVYGVCGQVQVEVASLAASATVFAYQAESAM